MKRIRTIFCIMISALLFGLLCSCSSPNTSAKRYVAWEVGGYDDTDGGVHSSEFSIWSSEKLNYHQDAAAPAEITVSFNGKSYTGSYQRSAVFIPDTYLSHRYKGDNVFFRINAETGELVGIQFVREKAEKATISEDECRIIAEAIADDYIDLSQYQVEVDINEINENFLYGCSFYRVVDGFKMADGLTVVVDGNGNVSSFGSTMLGSFSTVDSVELDQNNAILSVEAKLNSIYGDVENRTGYEVTDIVPVKLEDGSCAWLYTIKNLFEDGAHSYGSLVQLLVKEE